MDTLAVLPTALSSIKNLRFRRKINTKIVGFTLLNLWFHPKKCAVKPHVVTMPFTLFCSLFYTGPAHTAGPKRLRRSKDRRQVVVGLVGKPCGSTVACRRSSFRLVVHRHLPLPCHLVVCQPCGRSAWLSTFALWPTTFGPPPLSPSLSAIVRRPCSLAGLVRSLTTSTPTGLAWPTVGFYPASGIQPLPDG